MAGVSSIQYVASDTSVTVTAPAETADGDLLVAVIMRRSALTVPAGWAQLADQAIPAGWQWGTVLARDATASDAGASLTFTQSSAGRMACVVLALRSLNGSVVFDASNVTTTTAAPHTGPAVTASQDGELAVAVSSCFYALISGPTSYALTTESAGTLRTPSSVEENRLAVATLPVDRGGNPQFAFDHGAGMHSGVELLLLFRPA